MLDFIPNRLRAERRRTGAYVLAGVYAVASISFAAFVLLFRDSLPEQAFAAGIATWTLKADAEVAR